MAFGQHLYGNPEKQVLRREQDLHNAEGTSFEVKIENNISWAESMIGGDKPDPETRRLAERLYDKLGREATEEAYKDMMKDPNVGDEWEPAQLAALVRVYAAKITTH